MGFDSVIEKQWVTKEGFLATIIYYANDGARRGYISLPEGHKLEGVPCDSPLLEDIEVHGGLTFSEYAQLTPIKKEYWTFGFDCVHAGDCPDLMVYQKIFRDRDEPPILKDDYILDEIIKGDIRTLDYVERQCCKLSEQLDKVAKEGRRIFYCPVCGRRLLVTKQQIENNEPLRCECGIWEEYDLRGEIELMIKITSQKR